MPKTKIDYSFTVMYKIVCLDNSITDIYVGHTTDFNNRKHIHKVDCRLKPHLKLYQTINANGGWENWNIIPFEVYPCNNRMEAGTREHYWYKKLNANLNTNAPVNKSDYQREYQKKYRKECPLIKRLLISFLKQHYINQKLMLNYVFNP